MFREEASSQEREQIREQVKAWIQNRKLKSLCAISNHKVDDNSLLCITCEGDRLEAAGLTRIVRGEGLTYSNAEMFSQENYTLDLFVFCRRNGDRPFSEIVEQITQSINGELANV